MRTPARPLPPLEDVVAQILDQPAAEPVLASLLVTLRRRMAAMRSTGGNVVALDCSELEGLLELAERGAARS